MFSSSNSLPLPNRQARWLGLALVLALALAIWSQNLPGRQPAAGMLDAKIAATRLAFTPNIGQAPPAVRFQAHALEGALFFSADEVLLAGPSLAKQASGGGETVTLRLQFLGAERSTHIVAGEQLPGVVNYFLGDDPAQWRSNVPTYGSVTYEGLYEGIDLHYAGSTSSLKGTYIVAPGADPGHIRWQYRGAQSVSLDKATGDLVILLPAGAGWRGEKMRETAPIAWQEGPTGRQPVAIGYSIFDDGSIGLNLGAYDASRILTIDPTLVYSTLIGGGNIDEGRDIAVDANGNAYVTGSTISVNFPNAGPPQPAYGGPFTPANFGDAFILKLNPAGNALVYATYLGGSGEDVGDAIEVDSAGNVYVTGVTESTNFPTQNAYQPQPGGNSCSNPPCSDAFVSKLNAAGNALVFSTYLGGNRDENNGILDSGTRAMALGIDVDSAGNVYVTGLTESPNFPTVNQAFTDPDGAFSDIFVSKFQPNGQALLYSTYIGGSGADYSGDIAVDDAGNAYVAGGTLSSAFPTKNPFHGNKGDVDAIVAKFDTTKTGANSLVFSTYLGGDGADYGFGVGIGPAGQAIVAGHTTSLNFPTMNAFQDSNASAGKPIPREAFVARLGAAGNTLVYGTYLGGSAADVAYGLDVDDQGGAYITGYTASVDLPVKGAFQQGLADFLDVYIARFNTGGSGSASLAYSTYLGGTVSDIAYGIAISGSDAFVTGYTGGIVKETVPIFITIGDNGTGEGILVAKIRRQPVDRVFLPAILRQH